MDNPATCTALVLYAGDEEDDPQSPAAQNRPVAEKQQSAMSAITSSAAAAAATEGVAGITAEAGAGAGLQKTKSAESPTVSRFVGLSNQGATCYMNSLLQTLYMTPEVGRWTTIVDG